MIHAAAIPSVHHGSLIGLNCAGSGVCANGGSPSSRGFVLGFIRRDLATEYAIQNFVTRVRCVGTGGRGRRGRVGQAVSDDRVRKGEFASGNRNLDESHAASNELNPRTGKRPHLNSRLRARTGPERDGTTRRNRDELGARKFRRKLREIRVERLRKQPESSAVQSIKRPEAPGVGLIAARLQSWRPIWPRRRRPDFACRPAATLT